MVYKDTKIMELNNLVLDKDRQILDVQELCREKEEVAIAKTRAIQIMHEQLMEKSPERRTVATETLETLVVPVETVDYRRSPDLIAHSPGRAVAVVAPRGGTPPPVDPAFEDVSSLTTESVPEWLESTYCRVR